MSIRGQLAQVPQKDLRKYSRRAVNIAARLRDRGTSLIEVEVLDLSTNGCRIQTNVAIDPQSYVWLKLPGMEALFTRVIWVEDKLAGCEFLAPLHRGVIDLLVMNHRRKPGKRRYDASGRILFGNG